MQLEGGLDYFALFSIDNGHDGSATDKYNITAYGPEKVEF